MADPFATPSDFAAYIEGDVSTANADLVLAGASQAIRTYCGWDISTFSASGVYLDGSGSTIQELPALKVTDVTRVQILDVTVDTFVINGSYDYASTWVDITDYDWSASGLLSRQRGFPDRFRSVQVDFAGGYDTADLPDLKLLTCSLAQRMLASVMETVGGIQQTYGNLADKAQDNWSIQDMSIMSRYKLPGGA